MDYQKTIFKLLGVNLVFSHLLVKITGSIKAGLFLSHLIYSNGKGNENGWIYKTIKETEEETALSRHEQETAIKKLKELNIIDYKVKGIPAKRCFKINFKTLFKLVKNYKNKRNETAKI